VGALRQRGSSFFCSFLLEGKQRKPVVAAPKKKKEEASEEENEGLSTGRKRG
jgi:hypothetical protein